MKKIKITFVALGSEQLGISQLSAILKQLGYEVNLAFSASLFHDRYNLEIPSISPFFDDTNYTIKTIKEQNPDALAFSTLTSTYQWMLNVAKIIKEWKPEIKIIMGGVHVSAVPHLTLERSQVDYVVVGEGEIALPSILKAIENKDFSTPIFNTQFKDTNGKIVRGLQKGFNQELDSLPFFDKIIWEEYILIGDMYLTMASRGCPYRCTFCFNNFFAKLPEEKSGKYVRIRSVEHMIGELKFAKKRYNLKYVDFQDDVFTTSKIWLSEFLPVYKKEINVPFAALTHPKFMDDDIAKWIKEAGGEWIQMGVQSMDESFKKDNLMRYEKSDHINRALEVMHKHGLNAKVDHMLGLPNEPIEAQETARNLYAQFHPKRIQTFWTCYLPGTDMMREAQENGTLSKEQARKINEGEDFYFFRNTDNVKDPQLLKKYESYEFIFRVMPVLPKFIRKKLKPKHLKFFPVFLIRITTIFTDIINGFLFGVPEFKPYANHYIYHIKRFIMLKMGLKVSNATNTKDKKILPEDFLPKK